MNTKNPFAKAPLAEEAEEDTPMVLEAEEKAPEAPETKETKAPETKVSEDVVQEELPKEEKPKPKKLTPSQERDILRKQVEELEAKLEKAQSPAEDEEPEIELYRDRVLVEDGEFGTVRLVGDGKTLLNKDWKVSVNGLRLLVGRSSMQSQAHFQIPVSLADSLADLLTHLEKVQK